MSNLVFARDAYKRSRSRLLFLKSLSELDVDDSSLEDESSPLGTSLSGKPFSLDVIDLFLAWSTLLSV